MANIPSKNITNQIISIHSQLATLKLLYQVKINELTQHHFAVDVADEEKHRNDCQCIEASASTVAKEIQSLQSELDYLLAFQIPQPMAPVSIGKFIGVQRPDGSSTKVCVDMVQKMCSGTAAEVAITPAICRNFPEFYTSITRSACGSSVGSAAGLRCSNGTVMRHSSSYAHRLITPNLSMRKAEAVPARCRDLVSCKPDIDPIKLSWQCKNGHLSRSNLKYCATCSVLNPLEK